MKNLITLLILFQTVSGISQTIFKGFETGMTEDQAIEEFKKNKDDYKAIEIGNGFVYRTYREHLRFDDNGLYCVILQPKGIGLGMGYDQAQKFLEHTKYFFDQLDYEEFFVPEYWNAPLNFKSKYGVLLSNPEKTVMVHFYPTHWDVYGSTAYLVKLEVFNYDYFMSRYNQENEKQEKIRENSGF